MPWGRGGIGSTKHGKSGHSGPSPRAKFHRALDASREDRDKEEAKKQAAIWIGARSIEGGTPAPLTATQHIRSVARPNLAAGLVAGMAAVINHPATGLPRSDQARTERPYRILPNPPPFRGSRTRQARSQQPRARVIAEEFGIAHVAAERVHALVAAHVHHLEDRGAAPRRRCEEAGPGANGRRRASGQVRRAGRSP
jgi:hypothetical protein